MLRWRCYPARSLMHLTPTRTRLHALQGLLGELALLGFIGVIMFAVDRTGALNSAMSEMFETIHVVLFGVMVVFFAHCSVVLVFAAFEVGRMRLLEDERNTLVEDITELELAVVGIRTKTLEGIAVEENDAPLVDPDAIAEEEAHATTADARRQRRTSFIERAATQEREHIANQTDSLVKEGQALQDKVDTMIEKDSVQRYMRLFPLSSLYSKVG